MLFYTALLLASLLVAVIVLWAYRKVAYDSSSVYKTVHPEYHDSVDAQLNEAELLAKKTRDSNPWGWKGHQTPANVAKTHAAKPVPGSYWGMPESMDDARRRGALQGGAYSVPVKANAKKPGSGWPYREEKQEPTGKAYKVTRKAKLNMKGSQAAINKPWGW